MKTGSQLKRTQIKAKFSFKRKDVGSIKFKTKSAFHAVSRGKKSSNRGIYAAKLRAWTAFSKFIRQRDKLCITSGHPTTEAGHFLHNTDKPNKTLGGNELWYDERNVAGQCSYCNRWKDGNLVIYGIYLEEKYGFGIVQELRAKFVTARKYTLEDLEQFALYYEAKLAALQ